MFESGPVTVFVGLYDPQRASPAILLFSTFEAKIDKGFSHNNCYHY